MTARTYRRLAILVSMLAIVLALTAVVGTTQARAAAPAGDSAAESEFVSRTNAARAAAGVGGLAVADDLVAVARQHSAEMAAQGRIYHNPNLGSDVKGWQAVGENVGTGGSVQVVHDAFMNSPTHRDNILKARYTQVGIGVVWNGNALYVTEVFRQPEAAAPAPAPKPAAAPKPASAPAPKPAAAPAPVAAAVAAAPAVAAPAPAPAPAAPVLDNSPTPVSEHNPLAASVDDELSFQPSSHVLAVSRHQAPAVPVGTAAVAAILLAIMAGALAAHYRHLIAA